MGNKVLLFSVIFIAFACSPCYQQVSRTSPPRPRDRTGQDDYRQGPPRPFRFSYNNRDENGSTSYHQSEGDAAGVVRGSYGLTLANGLFRIVDYVADANGYRATVRTNEPGTANLDPADVIMSVEPVPEAVLRRYARSANPNIHDLQRYLMSSPSFVNKEKP